MTAVTLMPSGGIAVTDTADAPRVTAVASGGVGITLVDSGGIPMNVDQSGLLPFPGYSLGLDFVNGKYQVGTTHGALSSLPGYSQGSAPTITPGVGFVVAAGVNMTLLNSIAPPTGDFTLVVVGLSPPQGAVYYVAATLDDGFTSNANAIEMSRNNAGNFPRVRGIVSSAGILDNSTGTGTPAVTTPAIASGGAMRFGAYREGGLIKPILYGTKRAGTPAHSLTTLDSLRIGHRMVGGAANSPFTGGTIQKIFLINRVLSDAEIAAL